MLNLTSKTNCDTYKSLSFPTPLLLGLEFFTKPSRLNELEELEALHEEKAWDFDLSLTESYLREKSKAVVVTDTSQQIIWTSTGFTRMTGYTFCEVYNKKPSFLQGEQTQSEVRGKIKECLTRGHDFKGSIFNYRKSGQLYSCEVHIMPIYNGNQELVNFIALEEERKGA
ncbi:PAS domain S-box protein [Telluribacter sp.]|jgi:PAS domain S-box-containing protein|uniref:PAS domain-containing protein n=1 Tax=Telluribacter sp. TaxID=1978767 RepID=UPI002E0E9E73|nr:PAS domain S-box protein [Telluribacter sp.]